MEVATDVSEKLSYLNITLQRVANEQEMEDMLVINNDDDRTCLGVAGEWNTGAGCTCTR